jgi:hypothetical protein
MSKPDLDRMSLDEIGLLHECNKVSSKHGYLPVYEEAIARFRHEPITLLEIGIFRGASLRTWRDYFTKARIIGADIDTRAVKYVPPGVECRFVDQSDPAALTQLAEECGPFDVVVDDGSHIWSHQITTLRTLLPYVKPNGVYILEDLYTSYGKHAAKHGIGGGPTGSSFALEVTNRIIGHGLTVEDPSVDPFLAMVGFLTDRVTFAKSTAVFHRTSVTLDQARRRLPALARAAATATAE